jgi:hypothetical protein
MAQTAVIKEQIVSVDAKSLLANNTAVAAACQAVSWSAASTGDVLTVQSNGTVAFAAVSAGVGGSTGSTDNLVLRADGGGGATLQNSGWLIPDIYTASPNATVNHLSLQATGATTNVSVSIVPKGSGAFCLSVPDGTTAGGNARGANSIDLQTLRSNANQVASGVTSVVVGAFSRAVGGVAIGAAADARGAGFCIAIGENVIAGDGAQFTVFTAIGRNVSVTGFEAIGIGNSITLTGSNCIAIGNDIVGSVRGFGSGLSATVDRSGMRAHANDKFAVRGDCQQVGFILRNKTTTNAAVTLFLDGSSARLTIPSGKGLSADVMIKGFKSDGSVGARFRRIIDIKNVGGTTTLETTPDVIGTDYNPSGCSLSITADNTNDALDIAVTGIASETWRWAATVYGIEIAYGT